MAGDAPNRPEIEAQIAASEARGSIRLAEALGEMRVGFADVRTGFAEVRTGFAEVRTEFAEVRASIATLASRLEAVEKSTAGIKPTVIGTGIAVVAVVISVLAYGQTWFGLGISSRDLIRATVLEMRETAAQTAPAPAR